MGVFLHTRMDDKNFIKFQERPRPPPTSCTQSVTVLPHDSGGRPLLPPVIHTSHTTAQIFFFAAVDSSQPFVLGDHRPILRGSLDGGGARGRGPLLLFLLSKGKNSDDNSPHDGSTTEGAAQSHRQSGEGSCREGGGRGTIENADTRETGQRGTLGFFWGANERGSFEAQTAARRGKGVEGGSEIRQRIKGGGESLHGSQAWGQVEGICPRTLHTLSIGWTPPTVALTQTGGFRSHCLTTCMRGALRARVQSHLQAIRVPTTIPQGGIGPSRGRTTGDMGQGTLLGMNDSQPKIPCTYLKNTCLTDWPQ